MDSRCLQFEPVRFPCRARGGSGAAGQAPVSRDARCHRAWRRAGTGEPDTQPRSCGRVRLDAGCLRHQPRRVRGRPQGRRPRATGWWRWPGARRPSSGSRRTSRLATPSSSRTICLTCTSARRGCSGEEAVAVAVRRAIARARRLGGQRPADPARARSDPLCADAGVHRSAAALVDRRFAVAPRRVHGRRSGSLAR